LSVPSAESLAERCSLPPRRAQTVDNPRREIDATDRQIDQLVYQLYGLTDDEIRIVESATA
jgi:hypothetical protein